MNYNFISVCELLKAETDPDRFWTLTNNALANYGVTSILYCAIAFKREVDPKRISKSAIIKSNHPDEFFDEFGHESALDGDWTTKYCIEKPDILRWHGQSQWADATPAQMKRARMERDMGLLVGVSIPASRFGDSLIGGVGVSMAQVGLKEFDVLWRSNGSNIVAICGVLDACMRGQHLADVIDLSGREKECLAWLPAGLRPDQIADRLTISRSSVDKYIANSRVKLKSATPEQAVAKAVLFNLIQP